MSGGVGEFMEKNLTGNNRKQILFKMENASIFDIPVVLHTIRAESARLLDLEDL